jgi:hypothetical protein
MLSTEQAQNLLYQGYLVIDNFISNEECIGIRDEIAKLHAENKLTPEIATEVNEQGETVTIDERPFYALRLNKQTNGNTPHCDKYLSNEPRRICQLVNEALKSDVRPKKFAHYTTIDKKSNEMGLVSRVDTDNEYDFNKLACSSVVNAHLPKHLDNNGVDSQDLRKLTCILYLNDRWDSVKNGGQLRIYHIQSLFTNSTEDIDIDPVIGRMVLFWSE